MSIFPPSAWFRTLVSRTKRFVRENAVSENRKALISLLGAVTLMLFGLNFATFVNRHLVMVPEGWCPTAPKHLVWTFQPEAILSEVEALQRARDVVKQATWRMAALKVSDPLSDNGWHAYQRAREALAKARRDLECLLEFQAPSADPLRRELQIRATQPGEVEPSLYDKLGLDPSAGDMGLMQ